MRKAQARHVMWWAFSFVHRAAICIQGTGTRPPYHSDRLPPVRNLRSDGTHEVFEVPVDTNLRYPSFATARGSQTLTGLGPDTVLAIADATGAPEGIAYHPESRNWEHFPANLTILSWVEMFVPNWMAQPWHPLEVVLVTQGRDGPALVHLQAGSPWLVYRLTADASPSP